MKLSQINTEFKYRMNLISNFYERLQTNYLIDTFMTMKLKSLSFNYDRLFYLSSLENVTIINSYLNGVLVIMEENRMAEIETNKPIPKIVENSIFRLPFVDFEVDLQNYFVKIDQTLSKVNIILNEYFEENKTIGSMDDYYKSENYDEITFQTNLYDYNSASYFNVITVPHTDKQGNLIELKQGLPYDRVAYGTDKEKPSDFYARHGNATVITAGTPRRGGANATPSGPVIGAPTSPYIKPLAYMSDGTLRTFDRTMKVEDMIKQGAKSVFSGFWALVENGRPAVHDEEMLDPTYEYLMKKHPRSIIVQLKDKTILLVTTHGRFNRSQGMTYDEMIHFCIETLHAEFAYNLDGGGSSHQIVRGEYLTPMYDNKRTEERSVGSFLYIQKNDENTPGDKTKTLETLERVTEKSVTLFD